MGVDQATCAGWTGPLPAPHIRTTFGGNSRWSRSWSRRGPSCGPGAMPVGERVGPGGPPYLSTFTHIEDKKKRVANCLDRLDREDHTS